MSNTGNAELATGALSHLSAELGTLEFGDRVDFTIDGGFVGRIHFDETSIKDELVREIDAEFNLIAKDNPDALVEMFLVKHILLRASA